MLSAHTILRDQERASLEKHQKCVMTGGPNWEVALVMIKCLSEDVTCEGAGVAYLYAVTYHIPRLERLLNTDQFYKAFKPLEFLADASVAEAVACVHSYFELGQSYHYAEVPDLDKAYTFYFHAAKRDDSVRHRILSLAASETKSVDEQFFLEMFNALLDRRADHYEVLQNKYEKQFIEFATEHYQDPLIERGVRSYLLKLILDKDPNNKAAKNALRELAKSILEDLRETKNKVIYARNLKKQLGDKLFLQLALSLGDDMRIPQNSRAPMLMAAAHCKGNANGLQIIQQHLRWMQDEIIEECNLIEVFDERDDSDQESNCNNTATSTTLSQTTQREAVTTTSSTSTTSNIIPASSEDLPYTVAGVDCRIVASIYNKTRNRLYNIDDNEEYLVFYIMRLNDDYDHLAGTTVRLLAEKKDRFYFFQTLAQFFAFGYQVRAFELLKSHIKEGMSDFLKLSEAEQVCLLKYPAFVRYIAHDATLEQAKKTKNSFLIALVMMHDYCKVTIFKNHSKLISNLLKQKDLTEESLKSQLLAYYNDNQVSSKGDLMDIMRALDLSITKIQDAKKLEQYSTMSNAEKARFLDFDSNAKFYAKNSSLSVAKQTRHPKCIVYALLFDYIKENLLKSSKPHQINVAKVKELLLCDDFSLDEIYRQLKEHCEAHKVDPNGKLGTIMQLFPKALSRKNITRAPHLNQDDDGDDDADRDDTNVFGPSSDLYEL